MLIVSKAESLSCCVIHLPSYSICAEFVVYGGLMQIILTIDALEKSVADVKNFKLKAANALG